MADFVPNDIFREIRRKKLSRKELAMLLDTNIANIARWERGEAQPESAMLQKLCTFFAMTPEGLGFSNISLSQQKKDSHSQDLYKHSIHGAIYDSAIPFLAAVPIVGRANEIFQIKQRLRFVANREGNNNTLITLSGLPGVGKTTLATALAYDNELRAHFYDGILWAGLGPDPNLSDSLQRWGSLLGISESRMTTAVDVSSWADALHVVLEKRKMLLVIDDAWKLDDVLTFCIGGPNCAYLVTTRFAHIATHNGVEGTIQLQELYEEESIELLHLLAPRVVDAEPNKVRDLVHSVGGLPLALTLIGNYLRTQTANKLARRITTTLERLNHSDERLHVQELHPSIEKHPGLPGGALLSLQSVIAVSDQLLNPTARTTLYALSIFPAKPHSFSEEAALVIASCTYKDLDDLSDAGIIESYRDRYALHQVIADYACLHLQEQDEQEVRKRLITYVAEFVEQHRKEYDLLEVESSMIHAALDLTGQVREPQLAQLVGITCSFMPFLITRGLYSQAEQHLQRAYDAIDELILPNETSSGNPYIFIPLLFYLGEIAQKKGNLAQAESYFQIALERARNINYSEYTCNLLKNLGWIADKHGDYTHAHSYLEESLLLARQRDDNEQLCSILALLGSVLANQGEYGQAESALTEGLFLARKIDNQEQICALLVNIGTLYGVLGDFLHAEEYCEEGLFNARQLGHREWTSTLLAQLGDIANEHDNYQLAEEYFHEVVNLVREMGQRELLCTSLINLAAMERKRENYVRAHVHVEEGLALSLQIEQPQLIARALYEYGELYFDLELIQEAKELFLKMSRIIPPGNRELIALAHYGQARTLAAQGNMSEAREIGTESAEAFEGMGHRKTQEVRLWIEDLP